jgi:hypothetical protein
MPSDENKLDEASLILLRNPKRAMLLYHLCSRIFYVYGESFQPEDLVFDESKIPMFAEKYHLLVNKDADGTIYGQDKSLKREEFFRIKEDAQQDLPQTTIVNILYLSMLLAQHTREKGK